MNLKYFAHIVKCFPVIIMFFACSQPLQVAAQQPDASEFINILTNARKLTAEKKWPEAVAAWQQVNEANPVNGEYIANLGDAYYNNAQYAKAIAAYKIQIERGYGMISTTAYNIACCHALAGERKEALDWLEKSFKLGFRSYTHAQQDTDLKILHGDPRFIKIVALTDVSKMSRTQGWQYDMALLKNEVMRKAYLRRELSFDEFNKRYQQLYNSIDKKTDAQIILELMRIMVEVGDGHSNLFPPSRKEFQLALPVQFYFFKEGLYIIAAAQQYKHLVGSKVLAFEKKPVDEVVKVMSPYIARDNEMGVLQSLQSMIRHPSALQALGLIADADRAQLNLMDQKGNETKATIIADTLTVRVDHKSVPDTWASLQALNGKPVPLYLKNIKSSYWFQQLPGSKAVYFQWNTVRNDRNMPLNKFTDSLMKYINDNGIEKLVIDLRWNNGGNTMLLPYFINSIIKNEKINQQGNLYVITGRRTFSAAQNLSTFLEKQTNAIFAGEPTGSSPNFVGEEDFITLPYSKLVMNVSDWFWQSSWPWDARKWIAPAIYAPPTFKNYSNNQDDALQALQSVINGKGF